MEIAQNRQTVSDLINVTIFLAQHNMAFRGHRENWSRKHSKGNFKDLVLLMAQHSSSLQQHVEFINSSGKKEVSFLSWRRQNILIECISNNIALTIQEAIKTSGVFSISIDSTFDSVRKEQVSFIVRYVCKTTGVVNERLITMRESPYTSGVELFNLFKEVMAKNNLDWINNLIGQSYDGAANMRGEYKGVQSLIKNENKSAIYVWCHAHRLNLIVKEAVSSCTDAVNLFGNLETLYSCVWNAKKRVELFRSNQKKYSSAQNNLALKRVNTTRWSSHSAALNTVLTSHNAVIETLATIKLSEGPGDAKTGAAASGLLDYFTSYRFLIVAIMFKKLFQIIEPANKILQTRDLDLLATTNLIESAKHKIKLLNDRSLNAFQDIIKEVDQFVIDSEQEFTPIVVSRPKRCPKKSGELSKDTPILDPVKQIRIECFNKTLDIIQMDFSERFNINETSLMKDLSLISRRRIMEVRKNPETLPKDAFIIVCELYSKYLNRESLISEYQQFASNFIELEK